MGNHLYWGILFRILKQGFVCSTSQRHNDGLQRFGHHGLRDLQQLGAAVVRIRQHTALASCTAIVESRMENADLR